MLKKIFIFFALCLPSFFAAAQASFFRQNKALPARLETELSSCVDCLCDTLCAGRESGTSGSSAAAFFIAREFRSMGLHPVSGYYSQSFPLGKDSLFGHNVLGILENSSKQHSHSYIVIGAHFDGLGTMNGVRYCGADANASGVAAMLSIARLLRERRDAGATFGCSFLFVAFDAYNLRRLGSESFYRALSRGTLRDPLTGAAIRPSQIRMMIDLDQIGSSLAPLSSGRPDYLIAIGEHTLPANLQGLLSKCNRAGYLSIPAPNLELSSTYYGSRNFTQAFYRLGDRRIFIDHQIPTLYFTSGITDLTNRPLDTPSSLDYPVLSRRTLLIYLFLNSIQ